jgi:hypothetical protein
VSSWRSRRSRPAPSAVRTASSWRRTSARASRSDARFVHAISKTQNAAPSSAVTISRDCGATSSRRRNTAAPTPAFVWGLARSTCAASRLASARACSMDTSRFRRAMP